MALCELGLDHNAIDVAYSKSGTRIAVLTAEGIIIYSWQLKTLPPPEPKLESLFPFSETPGRPTHIVAVGEDDVYVLMQSGTSHSEIRKINLETKESTIVLTATESDRFSFIFPSLEQNTLWIARAVRGQKQLSYFYISNENNSSAAPAPWPECPAQETSWASATASTEKGVSYICYRNLKHFILTYFAAAHSLFAFAIRLPLCQ